MKLGPSVADRAILSLSPAVLGDKQEAHLSPTLCSALSSLRSSSHAPRAPLPLAARDAHVGLCWGLGPPSSGAAEAKSSAVRGPRRVVGDPWRPCRLLISTPWEGKLARPPFQPNFPGSWEEAATVWLC